MAPCNCGSSNGTPTYPAGVLREPASTGMPVQNPPTVAPASTTSGTPTGTTAPSGSQTPTTGQTQQFTLTNRLGTQSFGSRLEARAARVRQGGGQIAPR